MTEYSVEVQGLGSGKKERPIVPCNGCTACCRATVLLLEEEGDDVESYDYEMRAVAPGLVGPVLRQVSGHCVYLTNDNKCGIWERAPVICRVFDCRRYYLSKTRAERRRMGGAVSKAIFAAGRERVKTLTEPRT